MPPKKKRSTVRKEPGMRPTRLKARAETPQTSEKDKRLRADARKRLLALNKRVGKHPPDWEPDGIEISIEVCNWAEGRPTAFAKEVGDFEEEMAAKRRGFRFAHTYMDQRAPNVFD